MRNTEQKQALGTQWTAVIRSLPHPAPDAIAGGLPELGPIPNNDVQVV
jgi:hypothetical protein